MTASSFELSPQVYDDICRVVRDARAAGGNADERLHDVAMTLRRHGLGSLPPREESRRPAVADIVREAWSFA